MHGVHAIHELAFLISLKFSILTFIPCLTQLGKYLPTISFCSCTIKLTHQT